MSEHAQPAMSEAGRATEIALLNDAARAGKLPTSRIVFTRGLTDLLAGDVDETAARQINLMLGQRALCQLINETPIESDNDPHGERDFGVVEFRGNKVFWKIDVYANDGTFSWGSETPWDAEQSFRLVTVMLASNW